MTWKGYVCERRAYHRVVFQLRAVRRHNVERALGRWSHSQGDRTRGAETNPPCRRLLARSYSHGLREHEYTTDLCPVSSSRLHCQADDPRPGRVRPGTEPSGLGHSARDCRQADIGSSVSAHLTDKTATRVALIENMAEKEGFYCRHFCYLAVTPTLTR